MLISHDISSSMLWLHILSICFSIKSLYAYKDYISDEEMSDFDHINIENSHHSFNDPPGK